MLDVLSYVGVLEGFLVSALTGFSICAVIAYALMLKHGYQKEGFGRDILNCIYTSIRLAHIALFIVVLAVFIIFGLGDGLVEFQYVYGVKLIVLVVSGAVALGMIYRKLNVHYASAVNAGSWTFLSFFVLYAIYIGNITSILLPLSCYVLVLFMFQLLFIVLRKVYTSNI